MTKKAMLMALGLGIAVLLAACGSSASPSGGGSGDDSNDSIISFLASPSTHDIGEQVTFTWSVTNSDSYSCWLDVDGDGIAEKDYLVCPSNGSFNYTYEAAGNHVAKFYLGPISNPIDTVSKSLTTEKRYIIASYYRLDVIKDCDAGTAGAGEFGWDLSINGTLLSSVDQNNAVPISDGQYVDLSNVLSTLEIDTLSDTVSFAGHIYEYDNGSMISQPFTMVFGRDQNWGIQDPGRIWIKSFDISSSCYFKISASVQQ